ncbi:MAG: VCBS repeat-containing protein [Candidatus Poribacteria bacterium]|nr:VCBS repeat-containing protein [Candidatus Poribacteria bacterium]
MEFTDNTKAAGIDFLHRNGATGKRLFPEPNGAGCAFLDYDSDGWMDIYLVNSGNFQNPNAPNALYRNNGNDTFTDLTKEAGVGNTGFGSGICVGDYDNDGWEDIYICNFGKNVLYRNLGDGTFSDVTEKSGVEEHSWSTSATFFDADSDGDLDLYVANYLIYSVETDGCQLESLRVYCGPDNYPPANDSFYRNNGDGTFQNDSISAGLVHSGRGFGVITGDYDNDGDRDIFVANDLSPNFLYRNNGDGQFEEIGFLAGVALSEDGTVGNGMGIDLSDYNNDGSLDLVVTNYQSQVNTVYRNDLDGFFTDVSFVSGTGLPSFPLLSWGCGFVDVDNDGWRDLFVVNGHIHDNIDQFDDIGDYAQPKQLFRNLRTGTFLDMSSKSGKALIEPQVSRGAAFGDYDNDGDIDILINNLQGLATLLRNDGGNDRSWIRVSIRPPAQSLMARVFVETDDGLSQIDEAQSGGSYVSHNDTRLLFGLEDADFVRVWVQWQDGTHSEVIKTPTRKEVVFYHPSYSD